MDYMEGGMNIAGRSRKQVSESGCPDQ